MAEASRYGLRSARAAAMRSGGLPKSSALVGPNPLAPSASGFAEATRSAVGRLISIPDYGDKWGLRMSFEPGGGHHMNVDHQTGKSWREVREHGRAYAVRGLCVSFEAC